MFKTNFISKNLGRTYSDGLKQVNALSPKLFNIALEYAIRKV
jgi:hypothetical protein